MGDPKELRRKVLEFACYIPIKDGERRAFQEAVRELAALSDGVAYMRDHPGWVAPRKEDYMKTIEREKEVKIKCEKCGTEIIANVSGLCDRCHTGRP